MNITVASTPSNITFVADGAANVTDVTASNATNATILANHTDIRVLGRPDILMNVVDRVLVPPEAVFNQSVQALATSDLERASDPVAVAAAAAAPDLRRKDITDGTPQTNNSVPAKGNHAGCAGVNTLSVLFWVAAALLFAY